MTPHLDSVVSYLALLHILKKKLPNLPRLTRLSFYIRPPRQALAPISAGPVIPKNQTLTDILTDFTAALKKIGDRRIVNRSLKELSLECFPARIAWPASPGRWNPKAVQIERIFRRLQLESLKLSVVSPTIWQFGNPQFAADPSVCKHLIFTTHVASLPTYTNNHDSLDLGDRQYLRPAPNLDHRRSLVVEALVALVLGVLREEYHGLPVFGHLPEAGVAGAEGLRLHKRHTGNLVDGTHYCPHARARRLHNRL